MEYVTIGKQRNVAYAAINYTLGILDFVVTVRRPNGSTLNPVVSEQGLGIYTFFYTSDVLGLWGERIVSIINGDDAVNSIKVVNYDTDDLKTEIDAMRGTDSDTLKSLSDQLDIAQADLDNPDQYKADISGLALESSLQDIKLKTDQLTFTELNKVDATAEAALSQEEHDKIMSIPDIQLIAYIKNKRYLEKVGSTWYLVIRNEDDNGDILRKALKDKSGMDIADPPDGVMALEEESNV